MDHERISNQMKVKLGRLGVGATPNRSGAFVCLVTHGDGVSVLITNLAKVSDWPGRSNRRPAESKRYFDQSCACNAGSSTFS